MFTCSSENIAACSCSLTQVSSATRDFLSHSFYKCLCSDCLVAINLLVSQAAKRSFPDDKEQLEEGLHYYLQEDGYRVFTELYHVQRGHCCRNGCRHCAYGYKKKYWDG